MSNFIKNCIKNLHANIIFCVFAFKTLELTAVILPLASQNNEISEYMFVAHRMEENHNIYRLA